MIEIQQKETCPDVVFKYCSLEVFEKHYIAEGSFQLGTLEYYRNAYQERGAGYGDSIEGNQSILDKSTNQIFKPWA